ncbi:hypothetical protein SCA6_002344 [Theobroma cacao]
MENHKGIIVIPKLINRKLHQGSPKRSIEKDILRPLNLKILAEKAEAKENDGGGKNDLQSNKREVVLPLMVNSRALQVEEEEEKEEEEEELA